MAPSLTLRLPALIVCSLLLPTCPIVLTGCSRSPALGIKSVGSGTELNQRFPISAMARDANGDYDLVLVTQGLESLRKLRPGAELSPTDTPPIRQVVHIKLHWRPSRGAKANNPAAANATIRWLLFSPPTPPPEPAPGTSTADQLPLVDYVEYQGTAFVRPFFEREGYTVLIREGSVVPTVVKGEMKDPIGQASLEGKFYIKDDAATVRNILRELPDSTPAAAPEPTRPVTPPTTRRR